MPGRVYPCLVFVSLHHLLVDVEIGAEFQGPATRRVPSPTCSASGGHDCRLTRNRYQTVDDTSRIISLSLFRPQRLGPGFPGTQTEHVSFVGNSWSWILWASSGEIRGRWSCGWRSMGPRRRRHDRASTDDGHRNSLQLFHSRL